MGVNWGKLLRATPQVRRWARWLGLGLASTAAVVTLTMRLGQAFDLSKSDWAAWVQAIGSVVAIVASAGLVFVQHHLERRRANAEQRDKLDALVEPSERMIAIAAGTLRAADGQDPNAAVKRAQDYGGLSQLHDLIQLHEPGEFQTHSIRENVMTVQRHATNTRNDLLNTWRAAEQNLAGNKGTAFLDELRKSKEALAVQVLSLKAVARRLGY